MGLPAASRDLHQQESSTSTESPKQSQPLHQFPHLETPCHRPEPLEGWVGTGPLEERFCYTSQTLILFISPSPQKGPAAFYPGNCALRKRTSADASVTAGHWLSTDSNTGRPKTSPRPARHRGAYGAGEQTRPVVTPRLWNAHTQQLPESPPCSLTCGVRVSRGKSTRSTST